MGKNCGNPDLVCEKVHVMKFVLNIDYHALADATQHLMDNIRNL